jgi:hypothetical protein
MAATADDGPVWVAQLRQDAYSWCCTFLAAVASLVGRERQKVAMEAASFGTLMGVGVNVASRTKKMHLLVTVYKVATHRVPCLLHVSWDVATVHT